MLSDTAAVPVCIPTHSPEAFPFLHILTHPSYFCLFVLFCSVLGFFW